MSIEAGMGLMRNLGRFVGHLVAGFRADPGRSPGEAGAPEADRRGRRRHEMHHSAEECKGAGGVILRRTVIEEVEMPSPSNMEKDDHAAR